VILTDIVFVISVTLSLSELSQLIGYIFDTFAFFSHPLGGLRVLTVAHNQWYRPTLQPVGRCGGGSVTAGTTGCGWVG